MLTKLLNSLLMNKLEQLELVPATTGNNYFDSYSYCGDGSCSGDCVGGCDGTAAGPSSYSHCGDGSCSGDCVGGCEGTPAGGF